MSNVADAADAAAPLDTAGTLISMHAKISRVNGAVMQYGVNGTSVCSSCLRWHLKPGQHRIAARCT